MSVECDRLLKLVLVGDAQVGKSALLARFGHDRFVEEYRNTIGLEFISKIIDIDRKKVKLQVWDTAGQERFRTITITYYRGASGMIIVYDVTNQESFNNVCRWKQEIERYASENIPIVLVGNKVDLQSERMVDYSTAKEYAEENKIIYIETSAKNSTDTNKPFVTLAQEIINKMPDNEEEDGLASLALAPVGLAHRGIQKKTTSRTCSLL